MHWGVRRYQYYDGSLTSLGKKRYGVSESNNSKKFIVPSDATVIKKGTEFHRISSNDENNKRNGRTYLAYKKEDRDIYKKEMGEYLRRYGQDVYDVSYTNKKDIVLPSHKKQVDTFMELYKSKKKDELVSQVSLELTDRYFSMYGYDLPTNVLLNTDKYKEIKKTYSSLKDKKSLENEGYQLFMRTYNTIPVSKIYQKSLEKQGYNAIYDDNDIRYNTALYKKPTDSVIVFDRNDVLDREKATKQT